MTTKQVKTSITIKINTTARSIFNCTTMNSYVQYFQRCVPFAFTIEGSRHPLPHPTPLSYLFHFLSFFFFFSLCEEFAPFPILPLNLLNLLNMTTKQVKTSITIKINTTARSIFNCTTMNSYVQYFQRCVPFAFTIEGSRHPLPHPTPLSYLFHFLSLFFFFSLCEEFAPFPPYPAFIHFLSLYETVTPFPPYTVFIYFLSLYETVTPSPPYPAFIHFLSLYESVIPSPPYSAFIYSLSP